MEKFEFNISEELRRAIGEMGFEEPTPIQRDAIPPMLEGRDVIGQAQTGTGKTAAFGIPLVEKIEITDRRVQAIVLSPTRELALQTAGELNKLGRYKGISVLAVYGGTPIERQLRELARGVHVIIGTPGRVMDHMRRGTLDITGIKLAVLDEADEMLDMGFRDDIETILQETPATRQTALFSATMPEPILALGQTYLNDPVNIKVAAKEMTVDKVNQSFINVRGFQKGELLARLLVRDDTKLALVFCNTKMGVESVVTNLQSRGFSAAGLHGDMRQIERDAIMARFRNGMISVLVATDVAARGIDVDGVETVYNYDIPLDVEYYVHRVGRTGRAGREGRAYTFVVGREKMRMWDYRKVTGAKIPEEKAPTGEEIGNVLAKRLAADIAEHAKLEVKESNLALAKKLLSELDAETAVAALIGMVAASGNTKIDPAADLTIPEPVRQPRPERRGFGGRNGGDRRDFRRNEGGDRRTYAERRPYGDRNGDHPRYSRPMNTENGDRKDPYRGENRDRRDFRRNESGDRRFDRPFNDRPHGERSSFTDRGEHRGYNRPTDSEAGRHRWNNRPYNADAPRPVETSHPMEPVRPVEAEPERKERKPRWTKAEKAKRAAAVKAQHTSETDM